VARDVHTFGNSKLLPGQGSYIASLAVNFLGRGIKERWRVFLDGEEQKATNYSLIACCNGRHYGGGFFPVPEARMDDGVLNTLVVERVGRTDFLRFVGPYSTGDYYKAAAFARCVTAKEIRIEGIDEDVVTCLDGEIVTNSAVTIRLSDKKLNFFGPTGCDPNATAEGKRGG
jgi:diacylglycerol kinase family enzyme